MKTTSLRLVLLVALAVALVGAVTLVSADTNENADEAGPVNQLADRMSDHAPADHHDGHHADHAGQHDQHHADHAGQHADHDHEGGHY